MRSPFKNLIVSATLALGFAACGGPQEEQETSQEELEAIGAAATCPVAVGRELMITAVSVVEDPVRTKWTGSLANKNDGAWQFGRLMTAMAGTKNPSDFVLAWLNQWSANRTVNGEVVPARTAISGIINAWPKVGGKLDLTKAPLRLLAIVNRLDLRNLATSLVLMPIAPIGVWLGLRLARRIDPSMFYRLLYLGMFLTGTKLLWNGLS